jgi:high-affinity Fe2+/Pb2+ permease
MNKLRKLFFVLVALLSVVAAHTQTVTVESQDFMRSSGKIYVVVAVVIAIVIGLLLYVYSLDRKITKLEKK